MAQSHRTGSSGRRAEALAWLAEELAWEIRLESLRRPGRQPRPATTRPQPVAGMRRAS